MTLSELIELCVLEPGFFDALVADPLAVANARGYDASLANVKAVLGLAGVSDDDFGPALVARLQRES